MLLQGSWLLPVWDVQSTKTVFSKSFTEIICWKWRRYSSTVFWAVFNRVGSSVAQVSCEIKNVCLCGRNFGAMLFVVLTQVANVSLIAFMHDQWKRSFCCVLWMLAFYCMVHMCGMCHGSSVCLPVFFTLVDCIKWLNILAFFTCNRS